MTDMRTAHIEVQISVWDVETEKQAREWVEKRLGLGTVQTVTFDEAPSEEPPLTRSQMTLALREIADHLSAYPDAVAALQIAARRMEDAS